MYNVLKSLTIYHTYGVDMEGFMEFTKYNKGVYEITKFYLIRIKRNIISTSVYYNN